MNQHETEAFLTERGIDLVSLPVEVLEAIRASVEAELLDRLFEEAR